ncbi:4Fe-4S dicluster domain-containing protein [Gemmata sp. G18]|uniref:4Fe-4S dicluster domain-containing protein n=1 Tax=Gemmata palustris TaxID=2822762 RepID=A0ABS5BMU3_9BACT|nr:4Fe-4S dicluster domain-containing protein [Gemmata palustris]MBP3955029.1 4Fe-4S dicluster domain-containing protein [Gemmata palustris]
MAIEELEVVKRSSAQETAARGWLRAVVERLLVPLRRGKRPERQPAVGFYTDTTVCIGCKACEVACKQWNQLPADGFAFTGNSYDNTGELSASSWRHVKFIEQFPMPEPISQLVPRAAPQRIALDVLPTPEPVPETPGQPDWGRWLMMSDVCKHCAAAPCQQACPTGAIIYNEFANVYIQSDICNGCTYCVAACPFGVITRSTISGHARKCTLCYDRQKDGLVPACAKVCPTASIQFGPIDELRERARKRTAELQAKGVTGAHVYGDAATETYTELHSFYLLVDKPEVYGLPAKPFNPWIHMPGDYGRTLLVGVLTLTVLLVVFLIRGA